MQYVTLKSKRDQSSTHDRQNHLAWGEREVNPNESTNEVIFLPPITSTYTPKTPPGYGAKEENRQMKCVKTKPMVRQSKQPGREWEGKNKKEKLGQIHHLRRQLCDNLETSTMGKNIRKR